MKVNHMSIETKAGRKIIEDFSFTLNANDKLAIIGEEGNGKSTILKYIYDKKSIDEYCYYQGTVDISKEEIGYLEQSLHPHWNTYGAMDFFLYSDFNQEPNYEVYNEIYKIETLFEKYDIDKKILQENRQIETLSGGEKVKIQLIKIFIRNPKLILLDEPTNDIDMETILLLENFILEESTPILYVSHDEELLSKTANAILHLEQIKRKTEMKFTYLKTDYSTYIHLRQRQISQQNRDAYRTQKEKEDKRQKLMQQHLLVENDLDRAVRQPSWGRLLAKKMKNIKAQEKRLEQMPVVEYAQPEEAINAFFSKDAYIPNGKTILDLQRLNLTVENKILAYSISLKIVGPKHVIIIGKNGTGKTTLLKKIYEALSKKNDINLGYMPQNYEDEFIPSLSAVSYLQTYLGFEAEMKSKIMSFLGALNFQEYEMRGSLNKLSGGQKAKLYLGKLILMNCNVLLLDEPTRNLSPLSNPVIRNILKDFKGTILAVTHDRKMLKEVADEVYKLTRNGLQILDKE